MKRLLLIPLCIASLFLISCTSLGRIPTEDDLVLEEGEGIIVCKISSNSTMDEYALSLSKSDVSEMGSTPFFHIEVKEGDTAKIIIVKEGEYRFYKLHNGNSSAYLGDSKTFKVEANKINYIGDFVYFLHGKMISTDYIDNEGRTIAEALSQIPQLSEYEIVNSF